MKTWLCIVVIAVVSAIATWLMPWWMIAVCPFFICVNMQLKPGRSFIAGFAGIALFWLVLVLFRDIPNEHILSKRMATILGLPNYFLFCLITIILGGLVGGMAGWSGGVMTRAYRKE